MAFAERFPAESTGLMRKRHQWAGTAGRCIRESLPTWLVLLPFLLLVLIGERWQSQPAGWRFPLLCFCLLPFAVILNSARQQHSKEGGGQTRFVSRDLSDLTHSSDSPPQLPRGFQVSLRALYQQHISGLFERCCVYNHGVLSAINPTGTRDLLFS